MTIKDLKPKNLWKHFYDLTQIPRPSKHETQVVNHIKTYAENLGLQTYVDKAGNIIINKPATPGMENKKGVILQSHVDMVPQKNKEKRHDFKKDAIETIIKDEWVKANGTTLGADNGIGVAAMLAILEDKTVKHGPIECLFTIDEETGMTGAFELKPDLLKGDILLNLDTEDEDEICIGCAGGLDAEIVFNYSSKSVNPNEFKGMVISLKGLRGGHSGMDINLGRGNSIKLMARLLVELTQQFEFGLSEFEGGNLRNAIPREAFATISVKRNDYDTVANYISKYLNTVKTELNISEPDLTISISERESPKETMNKNEQTSLLKAALACPNGVIRMSDTMPGIVETSTNLASLNISQGKAVISCLLRSSIDSAKEALALQIKSLFDLIGASTILSGSYPGWKPNPKSQILSIIKHLYENITGTKPNIRVVHAGLECGILGAAYPNWDMVSFGPTIKSPHSPDERVHYPSAERFWHFLIEILENVPEK